MSYVYKLIAKKLLLLYVYSYTICIKKNTQLVMRNPWPEEIAKQEEMCILVVWMWMFF